MKGTEHPYYDEAQQVLADMDVQPTVGLSNDEVEERRARFGKNELEKEPGKSMFELVLEQFDDPLVKILLVAAVVSFGLSYWEGETLLQAMVEPSVRVSDRLQSESFSIAVRLVFTRRSMPLLTISSARWLRMSLSKPRRICSLR